jgi:hypothetical protein
MLLRRSILIDVCVAATKQQPHRHIETRIILVHNIILLYKKKRDFKH